MVRSQQTLAFKIQKRRREVLSSIYAEISVFLITLYAQHLEEGRTRIKDYGKMTMFDIERELSLRLQMIRNHNDAKVRYHFEEEQKRQDELLAKLKRDMQQQ